MTDTVTITIKGQVSDNFDIAKAELIRRTPWVPGNPSNANVLYFALSMFAEGLLIAEEESAQIGESNTNQTFQSAVLDDMNK